jgi:hypothetical protein
MDKLDNESWEEYAFRNNLFIIKYKDNKIIDDINIPTHTYINSRHYNAETYYNRVNFGQSHYISFLDFIMYELYNLKNKYKLWQFNDCIKVEQMTKELEEDINRQNWLKTQLIYWEKKYVDYEKSVKEKTEKKKIDDKIRYFELKKTISETHKEQLDELLIIVRSIPLYMLEGEVKSNLYSENVWDEREKEEKKKNQTKKIERIELYQKYLKKKEIQSQIMDLEQKLNQLKSQIVE